MTGPRLTEIEETVERVLRQALAHARLGVNFERSGKAQREEAIAPLEGHTKATLGMLKECLAQASLEGANSVHRALHAQPGVDPEMLDEAVEYAPEDGETDDSDPVEL